jgi:hypothetical protein
MKARRDATQHTRAAQDALLHDSSGAALAHSVAK